MSSRALFLILFAAVAFSSFASADDNCYPLVYACIGITALGAIAGLIYAYFRPIEIDVEKVQQDAMITRQPPGFLKYCMEEKRDIPHPEQLQL